MEHTLAQIASRRGVRFVHRAGAASTNDLVRDPSFGHGDVAMAEEQTAGRGQQGNSWHSEPGANLTLSLVLTPDFLPAGEQFYLLQAVSLGVADTLRELGLDARIKWPNDIYIGDKKVAGLLIENDICGMNVCRTIAGIGLNVNQTRFPDDLPNPTSIAIEKGAGQDRGAIFEALYDHLMRRYESLRRGETERLARDYHERLYRLGSVHQYSLPDGTTFDGMILGVALTGELQVAHQPSGVVHSYLFKEIAFL